MMASNTTSRFRSIAPSLGAVLVKRLVLHPIIQNEHVRMKRMHFANAKLNPRFPVVGWNSVPRAKQWHADTGGGRTPLRVGGYNANTGATAANICFHAGDIQLRYSQPR